MTAVLVLLLAYGMDVWIGDPPNRWHPVAWMGHAIGWARKHAPRNGRINRFLFGLTFVVVSCGCLGVAGWWIAHLTSLLPVLLSVPLQAWILKCTFSTSSLAKAARMVLEPMEQGSLAEAQRQLSTHLVSRDTNSLEESQVAAAVIESVAENTSDSVIAPLFFYCVFGLPGAIIYRFVNTCDAMLGYRTSELEWLGKFPARLDDVLNWLPARITVVLTLLVGMITAKPWPRAMRIWWRDRRLTASPNAGQPMSVAAGLLGVELEKVGYYVLGRGLPRPGAVHVRQSIALLWRTSLLGLILFAMVVWFASPSNVALVTSSLRSNGFTHPTQPGAET